MIVTYGIGSLAAELRLTLLSSREGRVVREGVVWRLRKETTPDEIAYEASEFQPLFFTTPGIYLLSALHQEQLIELGSVTLKKDTRTDCVFVINNERAEGEYFVDYDVELDFARRQQEREYQSEHGVATLALRDPKQVQGEQGIQLMAHPLLAQSAKFDGMPADIRSDPAANEAAVQLTLTAQLTNQNQPTANATPTPSRPA